MYQISLKCECNSAKENNRVVSHQNLSFSGVSIRESRLPTKTQQFSENTYNAFFVHIHTVWKAPCLTYFLISFPNEQQYAKLWLVGSGLPEVLIFSIMYNFSFRRFINLRELL